ncbi:hypothetical protein CIPAW_07G052300 [Carya illinoinensis]|uniref:Uncharacterized protein n=2 Tax=Carya illinoinensis TaxID=32201 RepID=A0A8T1Q1Z4_CARIL|nr:hypothetical protein CIPAW_07G052300 [Carya illinoinensis]
MFMTNDDSIGAFYIGYDDRVYCIRSLNEESNLETKDYEVESNSFYPKVICGSSPWGAEIPEFFNIRSFGSHVKLPIHPNLDNNMSKCLGCVLLTIYEVDKLENSDPRIFESSHPDHQFVQFFYHFETNEGPLKEPLVLPAPEDPFVGPFAFLVHVPVKWFLEQSNNLDEWSYIGVSIKASSYSVKVKECGARLLTHIPPSELHKNFYAYGSTFEIRHHLYCCLEMGSHVLTIRF